MNEIFTALVHQPIFNLLIIFYKFFSENLGLSIIAIALISRLILVPLAIKQSRMLVKNQEFSKKMKEIKDKFKNDKKREQEELIKIQSEYLPSQLAGCLPLVIQFILLITINNVFIQIFTPPIAQGDNNPIITRSSEESIANCKIKSSTVESEIGKENSFCLAYDKYAYGFIKDGWKVDGDTNLKTEFLGINMNAHPNTIISQGVSVAFIPYVIMILLVGATQYYSAKIMQPKKSRDEIEKEKSEKKEKKNKDNPSEDFSEIMQRTTQQTMFLLPILIMFTSFTLASGLSIYWITQSTFVIVQQFLFNKYLKKDKSV